MPQARPYVILPILVLWILLWYVHVWAAWKLQKFSLRDRLMQIWHRGILRIVGVRLHIVGELAKERPLLLVTNHLSYLDVSVLMSAAPLCFTPKSEIEKWPVFGACCRVCDAIFIDRRPDKAADMKARLSAALGQNRVICLFPEGTTGDGIHMQPFKSAFFQLAEEHPGLSIQPAAIAYTHIRRLPISRAEWPLIAWYGDMTLAPHLWELLSLGRIDVTLTFLPPVSRDIGNRKALAVHCKELISAQLH